jgi:hypothetical protein
MATQPHPSAPRGASPGRPRTTDDGRRLGTAGHALAVALLALVIGALLSAPGLHKTAFNQQPGLERDIALAVTGPLAGISSALLLDRPRALVKAAIGRSDDDEIDTAVVIPDAEEPGPATPVERPAVTPPAKPADKPAPKPVEEHAAKPGEEPAPKPPAAPAKVAFTPNKKLRLWVAGDSLVITPGYSIVRAAAASPVIEPVEEVDGRVATGLERPDVFNWFKEIAERMKELRPTVAVLHFGANDDHSYMTGLPKGVTIGSFGTASWKKEYGRRVGGVMDTIARAGGHTIWIGLPITRSVARAARFDVINSVIVKEARKRPQTVTYIDTYTSFAGANGRYAEYLENSSGRKVKVRAGDGVHFESAGGDMIARMVLQQLNALYDLTSWRKAQPS